MKMQTILRQGDVLLRRTNKKPTATAKTVLDEGRVILAYGEVTGHAHQVITAEDIAVDNRDDVPAQQLFEESDGSRLLVITQPSLLRHEEHDRIDLPVGNYEVIRQSEYTPAAIVNVAD